MIHNGMCACINTIRPPEKYTYKNQNCCQDNLPIRFDVIYPKYRDQHFLIQNNVKYYTPSDWK
jgi:hypothetical protein